MYVELQVELYKLDYDTSTNADLSLVGDRVEGSNTCQSFVQAARSFHGNYHGVLQLKAIQFHRASWTDR